MALEHNSLGSQVEGVEMGVGGFEKNRRVNGEKSPLLLRYSPDLSQVMSLVN